MCTSSPPAVCPNLSIFSRTPRCLEKTPKKSTWETLLGSKVQRLLGPSLEQHFYRSGNIQAEIYPVLSLLPMERSEHSPAPATTKMSGRGGGAGCVCAHAHITRASRARQGHGRKNTV